MAKIETEVADFVVRCLTCQQIKAEHQLPSSLLQPIKIPLWKWERVMIGFKLAKLYLSDVVRLHEVLVYIISDGDPRFTSRFWGKLHKALGLRLDFSIVFHPQTDGQSEMLGEQRVLGPELVSKTEVRLIRDHLKVASDRQKSYTDLKRRKIEYSVRDFVFLKQVGPVAYQLELPLELGQIHDIFHVSMLRHYHSDPRYIVPLEEIEFRPDLTFKEKSVQILERDVKVL
ncbi:uncharacterized protein [Gossypium hirsutum]|uniref:Tf2-1-like SH3-like domain-containing protein n=1 Tax=Gossypium hirsutum TaxID=3635 RepID=A0ABM2YKG8_GOSHI|nr:uncharacterized protein LOC107956402 [Gossypium hirsutum]